jgi:hypothetical protein
MWSILKSVLATFLKFKIEFSFLQGAQIWLAQFFTKEHKIRDRKTFSSKIRPRAILNFSLRLSVL